MIIGTELLAYARQRLLQSDIEIISLRQENGQALQCLDFGEIRTLAAQDMIYGTLYRGQLSSVILRVPFAIAKRALDRRRVQTKMTGATRQRESPGSKHFREHLDRSDGGLQGGQRTMHLNIDMRGISSRHCGCEACQKLANRRRRVA